MNSRSPSELRAGDWIAVGQMFRLFYFDDPKSGTECARKFGVNVGIQMLTAIDYQVVEKLAAGLKPNFPCARP
jgi:hypothetical protein